MGNANHSCTHTTLPFSWPVSAIASSSDEQSYYADILDEFLTHIQDADVQDTVDAQPEVAESNSSRLSRRGERKCRQLGITIDSQRMVVTRAYCDADLAPGSSDSFCSS